LYDELFIRHVENGRYESTFEHLKEVNPKLGEEMEEWMNHETE
jgi:phage terminase large subunit